MTFSPFQKNFLFVLLSVSALGGLGLGASSIINTMSTRREAARVRDRQARVERVMALNTCAHFTDGERARLDKVDLDPMGTKRVLLAIHKERMETWASNFQAALESMERYRQLHRDSPSYISYLPEFTRAKDKAAEALKELRGFEAAVKALEALDPMADPKKVDRALDTPKPAVREGAV